MLKLSQTYDPLLEGCLDALSLSEDENPQPYTFQTPGLRPDVRFKVFRQEFLINSIYLRLNSVYFHRFLDTSETSTASTIISFDLSRFKGHLPNIKYDFVTKIDEDGEGWHVVKASELATSEEQQKNDTAIEEYSNLIGAKLVEHQEKCFRYLLTAITGRNAQIHDLTDLETTVGLADYYLALPCLSRSIDSILLRSNLIRGEFPTRFARLLPLAFKLRHTLLLQECIIHCVNPFEDPLYHRQGHNMLPNLKVLCIKVHNRICSRVAPVQKRLLEPTATSGAELKMLMRGNHADGNRRTLPELMRMIYDGIPAYREDIAPLMENRLRLNCGRSGEGAGMPGRFEEYFLFATAREEDLPWEAEDGW